LNPKYDHEKEYRVEVDRKVTPGFLRNLEEGVVLGGVETKKAKVKKVSETVFNITLTEGRNRQIKRMTEKLGFSVRNLKRIRIQNINLGVIPKNSFRELTPEERDEFLSSVGLV
jgi:pseudouridine synthase